MKVTNEDVNNLDKLHALGSFRVCGFMNEVELKGTDLGFGNLLLLLIIIDNLINLSKRMKTRMNLTYFLR